MRPHPWLFRSAVIVAITSVVSLATIAFLRRDDGKARLIKAASRLHYRPTDAPLVSFPFRPAGSKRGPTDHSPDLLLLRGTAGEILREETEDDPASLHQRGVALLLAGDPEQAVTLLEKATRKSPHDASSWADLAAARYEEARNGDSPELFALALGAAYHAILLDSSQTAPRFTRALALEQLALRPSAQRAYRDYLALDGVSEWSDEARRRLKALTGPTVNDEWQKARGALETACEAKDLAASSLIITRFPQHARTWGEGEYLGRWGEQRLAGHNNLADHWLRVAECLATGLQRSSGETLLRDSVLAIQRASETGAVDLATAHDTYRKARILYSTDQRRVGEALPLLRVAENMFRRHGSPMALMAAYYEANAMSDRHDVSGASKTLDDVSARAAPGYKGLRAHLAWQRTTILASIGRPYQSLEMGEAALRQFRLLKEIDHETMMELSVASLNADLGDDTKAWKVRRDAFRHASESGRGAVIEAAFAAASLDALRSEQWDVAAAFLDDEAHLAGSSPRLRAQAFLWRAVSTLHLREVETNDVFREARLAAFAIRDDTLRAATLDEIRFAEASAERDTNPRLAADRLTATIDFRVSRHLLFALPEAYVERARAWRKLREDIRASSDLDQAMALVEERRELTADAHLRDTFLAAGSAAFAEAIDLAASREEFSRAFELAERSRARAILDATTGSGASPMHELEVRSRLSTGALVVQLTTLPSRTIAIALSSSGLRGVSLDLPSEEIRRLGEEVTSAILREPPASANDSLRKLYTALLQPFERELSAAKTVVIIPDDSTAALPFAAAVNPRTSRHLIEDYELVISPSATVYVAQHPGHERITNATLIADPHVSAERFPNLRHLEAARSEARDIGRLYEYPVVIEGGDATYEHVVAATTQADVIHFVAHAVINRRNSSLSAIPLAPGGVQPDALYLRDIAALRLKRAPIVILATCQGAAEAGDRGQVRSLASAFIEAGSRAVAASLWDVDDTTAREFSIALHRELRTAASPAAAMRRAQLTMLRSPDVRNSAPRSWSGFQLYGTQ